MYNLLHVLLQFLNVSIVPRGAVSVLLLEILRSTCFRAFLQWYVVLGQTELDFVFAFKYLASHSVSAEALLSFFCMFNLTSLAVNDSGSQLWNSHVVKTFVVSDAQMILHLIYSANLVAMKYCLLSDFKLFGWPCVPFSACSKLVVTYNIL